MGTDLNAFAGLSTYRRNIEHILHICDVVLSTYCHFLYPEIADDREHQKYEAGVREENAAMRELANRFGCVLVDAHALMPRDEKYFVDSVHFTPDGMQQLASLIADPILRIIDGRRGAPQH